MDPVDLSASLTVYGPLGILALLATLSTWKLYRDRERERKKHREEMTAIEDKYISKAEDWMAKYAEFAKVATQVVDAAMRRYRNGGSHGRTD